MPDHRECHCLDPDLGAHHRRPLRQAVDTVMPPPSTLTLPPSERTGTVDVDPASLGACHRRPLPQALDTASGEGATPPLPHYRCLVNVFRNVNEI
jgi:hypothetical protein